MKMHEALLSFCRIHRRLFCLMRCIRLSTNQIAVVEAALSREICLQNAIRAVIFSTWTRLSCHECINFNWPQCIDKALSETQCTSWNSAFSRYQMNMYIRGRKAGQVTRQTTALPQLNVDMVHDVKSQPKSIVHTCVQSIICVQTRRI